MPLVTLDFSRMAIPLAPSFRGSHATGAWLPDRPWVANGLCRRGAVGDPADRDDRQFRRTKAGGRSGGDRARGGQRHRPAVAEVGTVTAAAQAKRVTQPSSCYGACVHDKERNRPMSQQPLVPAELLDRVVSYFHPRRVILFGSQARRQNGPDSDFDLLVILDADAPAERLTL